MARDTAVRDYFESQGFVVNWNDKNKSIEIIDPKTGHAASITQGFYDIDPKTGKAMISQDMVKKVEDTISSGKYKVPGYGGSSSGSSSSSSTSKSSGSSGYSSGSSGSSSLSSSSSTSKKSSSSTSSSSSNKSSGTFYGWTYAPSATQPTQPSKSYDKYVQQYGSPEAYAEAIRRGEGKADTEAAQQFIKDRPDLFPTLQTIQTAYGSLPGVEQVTDVVIQMIADGGEPVWDANARGPGLGGWRYQGSIHTYNPITGETRPGELAEGGGYEYLGTDPYGFGMQIYRQGDTLYIYDPYSWGWESRRLNGRSPEEVIVDMFVNPNVVGFQSYLNWADPRRDPWLSQWGAYYSQFSPAELKFLGDAGKVGRQAVQGRYEPEPEVPRRFGNAEAALQPSAAAFGAAFPHALTPRGQAMMDMLTGGAWRTMQESPRLEMPAPPQVSTQPETIQENIPVEGVEQQETTGQTTTVQTPPVGASGFILQAGRLPDNPLVTTEGLYEYYRQLTGRDDESVREFLASPQFQAALQGAVPAWMAADPVWRLLLTRAGVSPEQLRLEAIQERLNKEE